MYVVRNHVATSDFAKWGPFFPPEALKGDTAQYITFSVTFHFLNFYFNNSTTFVDNNRDENSNKYNKVLR